MAELSKKAVDEYFESGGLVVPEEEKEETVVLGDDKKLELDIPVFTDKKEKKAEAKTPEKAVEKTPEKAGEEKKKEEKKEDKIEDPHAENHKKAMQEERARRKALEKQVREEAERRAALENKFNTFIQQVGQAQAPQPGTQEREQYEKQQTDLRLQQLEEEKRARDAQDLQTRQLHQFKSTVIQAASPFISQTKDYQEAYQHVMGIKAEELRLAGMPEENIANQLGVWEAQFAALSLQSEKSPSEQLYILAQRLGYKQKTVEKPGQSEADKKLENVQKGQEAAKTLEGGGSGADFSLATLEQMSDEQIAAIAKDPKKWAKVAGGHTA